MRTVIDIETDKLVNPTKIWVVVCKDVDTDEVYIWRNGDDTQTLKNCLEWSDVVIGHNLIGFDRVWLSRLLPGCDISIDKCFDTLIASKLYDYSRKGHSIEDYGLEYGLPKGDFKDFSKYSQEMEDYCVRDVEITTLLYLKLRGHFTHNHQLTSLKTEQRFQEIVNDLHDNGFGFNRDRALVLLSKVEKELGELDEQISASFPPRLKLVREITPVFTQHNTLNRKDFRWITDGDLSDFNGGPFCRCAWTEFNPSSHKQIIEVLHQAGWKPTDRTKTWIEKVREQNRTKVPLDITDEGRYSWKINETNLSTLPTSAPSPARMLARRILLESRRRTLVEWLGLVSDNAGQGPRIHGQFFGIGAWTQRMAHQKPNTANIPNSHDISGKLKLYGAEMRALWCAPKNRLLVGVDAEGIQLRIFAHLIDDEEFTHALVQGRKEDKSDPHSLNQRVIGRICKSRASAKRFIYALLLGAGLGKLAEILECSREEAQEALDRLLTKYHGWGRLKAETIPRDAQRGYFYGLDGRKVKILGDTASERRHLAMSGYLQNGEVVIMKLATLLFYPRVKIIDPTYKLVNFVHDEWQSEVQNDFAIARKVAIAKADSLREVGEMLGLKCPLAGSYCENPNDINTYTIGTNWKVTH